MNVKRFPSIVAAAAASLVLFACAAQAALADVGVTVNGSAVDISPAPIVQDGRVFVPLRGVFEQLGASVVYDNGTITAQGNGRDIELQIGSTQATVNGQQQTIDVAPFIVGASTFVPLRFISEALGDSVNWDEADSIAAINTAGGSADYFAPGTASYVDSPPPAIPEYDQPPVPQPNYLWQPGYWAWGSYGYYWVPGTWVQAPQPGYLWTPGYWQANNNGFNWNPGYWAIAIGFYGGINYGGGYFGHGYSGGRWQHNVFQYNTYVTHVNTTIVHNVYVDRSVAIDRSATRIAYNGGSGGVSARPTANELQIAHGRHLGMTAVQRAHVAAAEGDARLLATSTHDKPAVLAVARPFSQANRPAGFVPVKPSERIDPQAHVAPVHVTPAHAARPASAYHPSARPAPVDRPAAHLAPVDRPGARPVTVDRPAAPAQPETRHAAAAHTAARIAPAAHGEPAHPPVAVHEPAAREPVAHAPAPVHEPVAAPVRPIASVPHRPEVYAAPPATHAAPPRPAAPLVRAAPPAAPRAAPPHAAPAAHGDHGDHKEQRPPH